MLLSIECTRRLDYVKYVIDPHGIVSRASINASYQLEDNVALYGHSTCKTCAYLHITNKYTIALDNRTIKTNT